MSHYHRDMPSSFKANKGKVVHQLRAQLKLPMSFSKDAKAKFTFEAKPDMTIPMLMVRSIGADFQLPIDYYGLKHLEMSFLAV